MIKIAAILLFFILSTTASRDFTRHIINRKVFLKRSVETRQSSCYSIIEDCNDRVISLAQQHDLTTNEGLARFLSDVVVLQCGSCFDEYESFYRCTGDDDLAEQLREADCARSDIDGKYCAESLYDGIANGDLPACDEEDDVCVATCQDLRNLRTYWGCCTTSFEQHGLLANTTQEYDDCDATLGEPCSDGEPTDGGSDEPDSGVSVVPVFLVIAVLLFITSSVF